MIKGYMDDMGIEHHYFECTCSSAEHTVRFTHFRDDEWPCVFVETHLYAPGFWSRLWRGLRFIFGRKCKYGEWDETELRGPQVRALRDLCDQLLRDVEETTKTEKEQK